MSEGISGPFIRHPIATSLLMVAILFIGFVAYPRLLGRAAAADQLPLIEVSASFPGASPETIAATVTSLLETQFAQIRGVTEIRSATSLGSTSIRIQFDADRDLDAAASDVQAAIDAASGLLPANLPGPPTYRKISPADLPNRRPEP
jgi:HAE1 family hydrophobic/amphiphilic exporter-1